MTKLYAAMTPEDRVRRAQQLTAMTIQLSLAGLRNRHPNDSKRELLLRLARIRLGADIATAVYGAEPAERDTG